MPRKAPRGSPLPWAERPIASARRAQPAWTRPRVRRGFRTAVPAATGMPHRCPGTVDMGAWTPESEPVSTGGGAVTLVEGSSFCICTPGGDLGADGPHGVFFQDTRIL